MDFKVSAYPESWDVKEQITILEQANAEHSPELIIISPATNNIQYTLKQIHLNNASIITVDQFLGSGNYAVDEDISFPITHIAINDESAGIEMAKALSKLIDGKGKIYVNSTFPDIKSISDRLNAFLNVMDEYPNITITGIDIAGIDFSNKAGGGVGSSHELQKNAYNQTLTILQKHPDIAAIYCTNPLSASGVIQALDDTGLSGSIKVAAWDATKQLIQALDDGVLNLVMARNPLEIGSTAVFWGYQKLIFKEAVPQNIQIPFKIITQEEIPNTRIKQYIYHWK